MDLAYNNEENKHMVAGHITQEQISKQVTQFINVAYVSL